MWASYRPGRGKSSCGAPFVTAARSGPVAQDNTDPGRRVCREALAQLDEERARHQDAAAELAQLRSEVERLERGVAALRHQLQQAEAAAQQQAEAAAGLQGQLAAANRAAAAAAQALEEQQAAAGVSAQEAREGCALLTHRLEEAERRGMEAAAEAQGLREAERELRERLLSAEQQLEVQRRAKDDALQVGAGAFGFALTGASVGASAHTG